MKTAFKTRCMVESALMVALATALSLLTVAQMPYGGSVTVASMLPVLLVSYRHGVGWGLGAGAAFAVLQQLLGLSNLSYFTTWQSVVAVIVLDYALAFTLVGLGGIFRRIARGQRAALVLGAVLVSLLRYACHVIAGATVWAGLSIPNSAALLYSLGYNATYMIPEAIVLIAAAWYLSSVLDFSRQMPVRITRGTENGGRDLPMLLAMAVGVLAVVADAVLIFPHLQNAEDGSFDLSGLAVQRFSHSFWLPTVIVSGAAMLCIVALWIWHLVIARKAKK